MGTQTKGQASIYALFGGQGTNKVHFDGLQSLYDISRTFLFSFTSTVTKEVFKPLAEANESSHFYASGMDVAAWLSNSSICPSTPYLASAPISFPLIGLSQLAQYLVVCRVLGFTPGEMHSRIAGTNLSRQPKDRITLVPERECSARQQSQSS
jgi:fatty acid synthase subunit alpha